MSQVTSPCLGVDFGTTHTSAAVYGSGNDNAPRFLTLDPLSASPTVLRSMIYVNRTHEHRLGMEAVQTFLREDTGREAIFEERVVGVLENTVASLEGGPITIIYDTHIEEDIGARGRLLQSIKTGLRSPSYWGTNIFGRDFTIQELIALILRHVREQAEAQLGQTVRCVTLGRPVKYADEVATDQLAEQRMREAAALAGFEEVSFLAEPVAAALFYLQSVQEPQTLLVFDFGGGTLDLTVLRADQRDHEILSAQGVLIGGDDLDSALMREYVAPRFGTTALIDTNYDGSALRLPADDVRLLYQWQTIPQLSRPKPLARIQRARRYGSDPAAFAALETLVTQNYGFPLFERIETAKRALSAAEQAHVTMRQGNIDLHLPITRRQFNAAIRDEVADARIGVRAVLASAGVAAAAVDVVVTTGGSSAIPLFQQMLAREFPAARFVQSDRFGSVTGGLAIAAARGA